MSFPRRLALVPTAVLVALLAIVLGAAPAFAHPTDEVLQQAYLSATTNRLDIELDLTPGERVGSAFAAALDTDHNRELDVAEIKANVARVVSALHLRVDGRPAPLTLTRRSYPSFNLAAAGGGVVTFTLSAHLPAGSRSIVLSDSFDPKLKTSVQMSVLVPDQQPASITGIAHDDGGRTVSVTVDPGAGGSAAGTSGSGVRRSLAVPTVSLALVATALILVVGYARRSRAPELKPTSS